MRRLVIVFGGQFDLDVAAFDGFAARCDLVRMAEVANEATLSGERRQAVTRRAAAIRGGTVGATPLA